MKTFVSAAVGFAAGPGGNGVAYARIGQAPQTRTLRVPFQVRRYPALLGREIGYEALSAVAAALLRRGIGLVEIAIDDDRLYGDLTEHHDLPAALTLAYVRLRCRLNQFAEYRIRRSPASDGDLSARACGEVAMHVAA